MSRVREWLYWQLLEARDRVKHHTLDRVGLVIRTTKRDVEQAAELFEMGREMERLRMGQRPRSNEPRKRHLALVSAHT